MYYFLLDKDYAIKNESRCIGKSEIPFKKEQIEQAKKLFNTKEVIIFQGEDIPHYIVYDPINNIISEKILEEIQEISTYSEVAPQEKKIFDEDVEIEPEVYYFYINKNIADTQFLADNMGSFRQPLLSPDEYLGKPSYMIKGRNVPHYITVEDGKVREATEYEKYTRGQRKLQDREVAFKNEIIYLEDGWYIQNDELIKVEKPTDMVKPVFNEEKHIWEETATEDEISLNQIQTMYNEYSSMDTPSVVKEMEIQDPEMAEEFLTMLIELRTMAGQISEGMSVLSILPEPSKELVAFKNKFKGMIL